MKEDNPDPKPIKGDNSRKINICIWEHPVMI